jgi:hypothetical protein
MNRKSLRTKNIFSVRRWHRKYFSPAHNVNPQQDYYICKPDAGLSITSVNFFQDESQQYCTSVRAGRNSDQQ